MTNIYQVDAFTTEKFKGNPAAICVLDKFPDSQIMLNLAKEMNLSETAYVVKNKDEFDLRWFTPTFEIDLCGHATLATAHILWSENFYDKNKPIIFNTKSGKLIIKMKSDLIEMDFPSREYSQVSNIPSSLIEGLGGIRPIFTGISKDNYLLQLETEEEVKNIKINISKLMECDMHGVIVTAKSNGKYDFISRFFAPEVGVPEDPVTGSAHCTLATFWKDRLNINTFKAYQCSERGGELEVELLGDRVLLKGKAVTIFRGKLTENL